MPTVEPPQALPLVCAVTIPSLLPHQLQLMTPIELALQDAPTSLALDTLIQEPDDLAILIKTLREVERHTVTTISMRHCALKNEECVALLCELCREAHENEKPKGVLTFGPNLCILETLYLRYGTSPYHEV